MISLNVREEETFCFFFSSLFLSGSGTSAGSSSNRGALPSPFKQFVHRCVNVCARAGCERPGGKVPRSTIKRRHHGDTEAHLPLDTGRFTHIQVSLSAGGGERRSLEITDLTFVALHQFALG